MATHGSSGAGGPLLRVGDMLHDLAEDDSITKPVVRKISLAASLSSSDQISKSAEVDGTANNDIELNAIVFTGLEKQDLPAAFEETYNELDVALTHSGHPWTGLTQELCATLTTADKLVATSQLNLRHLSQEVKKLEKIVERGEAAVTRLQSAIGQVKDEVPVS